MPALQEYADEQKRHAGSSPAERRVGRLPPEALRRRQDQGRVQPARRREARALPEAPASLPRAAHGGLLRRCGRARHRGVPPLRQAVDRALQLRRGLLMTYWWLVENFTKEGQSTGLYMACQANMTLTADVNAARKFRTRRTAEFRAADMREARRGDWRAVEHGFEDSMTPNARLSGAGTA